MAPASSTGGGNGGEKSNVISSPPAISVTRLWLLSYGAWPVASAVEGSMGTIAAERSVGGSFERRGICANTAMARCARVWNDGYLGPSRGALGKRGRSTRERTGLSLSLGRAAREDVNRASARTLRWCAPERRPPPPPPPPPPLYSDTVCQLDTRDRWWWWSSQHRAFKRHRSVYTTVRDRGVNAPIKFPIVRRSISSARRSLAIFALWKHTKIIYTKKQNRKNNCSSLEPSLTNGQRLPGAVSFNERL